jgi:hypothetical protein
MEIIGTIIVHFVESYTNRMNILELETFSVGRL